ncbi:hypothetical protein G6N76_11075 [Rhizobium daejeonense]|uniref:Uncharacterized protein n=1 Tax=Rhizobium daejeonense TaxID=240521 RepID=A0A6M1S4Y3_9HYPH|nr:hypothetical protein [Rhizobium daejeonense]NGO64220.1 hypothetical protein [Rhizobium daejeonense]
MTIALTIVTDRPDAAVRALFGFSADRAPDWLAVISSIGDLSGIPTGAPVLSLWFSDGSTIEAMWREERSARSFDLDFQRHADRIADWLARRDASERKYCAEACGTGSAREEAGTGAADQPVAATSRPSAPPPAALPARAPQSSPLATKWS